MDSRIDRVNSVTCEGSYSCKNCHFSGVEYNSIKCTRDDSCVNTKGKLYACKGSRDYICPITEICAYAEREFHTLCQVFCYGECFATSKRESIGIPRHKDYLYPLYHICIPWYLYFVYLLPYLVFWLCFDYYFNIYLPEKFDTILLLFDQEFDLLGRLDDENGREPSDEEDMMQIYVPRIQEQKNHIYHLKCLLCFIITVMMIMTRIILQNQIGVVLIHIILMTI